MIKNVMLIDDNKIDLFINQRIIEKYDASIKSRVFTNAASAMSFFKLLELNVNIKSLSLPDVIFLDVNMPEMNGFNFFEEFKWLNLVGKDKIEIYMLSSSLCPADINRAEKEGYCSGYVSKPLTVDKLQSILRKTYSMEQCQQFSKII